MISNKTIFIAPLDWGLGHATRCVPIIKDLLKNNKVLIGVTPLNEDFFKAVFPNIQKINVPSYSVAYSEKIPVWLKLILQGPKIKAAIDAEKKRLNEIIELYKIDLVISDNRFGLSTKKVKCIFITHQLKIKSPFFTKVINLINQNYIHSFNEVWVPDYENVDKRLSGRLSDSEHIRIPVTFIGPKSSLVNLEKKYPATEKFDYLILLSGVEPQRTILENLLIEKFKNTTKKVVLVRGSHQKLLLQNNKILIYNFAVETELRDLIVNAETVICRSGYSTLMDLHLLEKKQLILVPTPGQTEQEYLAEHWRQKFESRVVTQKKIKTVKLEGQALIKTH